MTAAAQTDDDPLVDLYREFIGEPDSRTDVYLGFGVFFAGLGLGLVGLVLFAIERGLLAGDVFWLRQLAFATGALGLPLVFGSVVVLLPADRRALYVAAGGLIMTLVAIAFFVAVYPDNWNFGADYSLQGVAIYAVGLVSVLAATGSALVGYHVERVQGGPAGPSDAAETGEREPAVTDEQVQRDIEEAMADTEISWGGVEKVETEQLTITSDADIEGQQLDSASARVHRSRGVDEQLSALKGLQGGEQRTGSGRGVDDQSSKLQALREQQRQEEHTAESGGWLARLKSLVGR